MGKSVPFFQRIQVRLLLRTLLFAYVPMAALAWFSYDRTRRGYEVQVARSTVEVAERLRSQLVGAIAIANRQLDAWTYERDARDAPRLRDQTFNIFEMLKKRFRAFLTEQRKAAPLFASVLCVAPDAGGQLAGPAPARVLYAADPAEEGRRILPGFFVPAPDGATPSPRYLWQDGVATARAPEPSPFDAHAPVLPIAAPYRSTEGDPVALIGLLDWRALQRELTAALQPAGDARALRFAIVDDAGRLVGGDVAAASLPPATARALVAALQAAPDALHRQKLTDGRAVVAGASRVREAGWSVLVLRDARTALAPIEQLELANLAACGVLLLLLFALALQMTAGVTRPLRQLVGATQRLADGDLGQNVQVPHRDEVGELAGAINTMASRLRALLVETATSASREREMTLARTVQDAMLPESKVHAVGGLRLLGVCKPAAICGGDWWGFQVLNDRRVLVTVADVNGHGMPSAMVTANARGAFEALAHCGEQFLTPQQVLRGLHRGIGGRHELRMTSFAAVLDLERQVIDYAGAAHTFPLLFHGDEARRGFEKVSMLNARGQLLGTPGMSVTPQIHSAPFRPGDLLLCYSDGIVEAEDGARRQFGARRLSNLLLGRTHDGGSDWIAEAAEHILAEVERFTDGAEASDDRMLVLCWFAPDAAARPQARPPARPPRLPAR